MSNGNKAKKKSKLGSGIKAIIVFVGFLTVIAGMILFVLFGQKEDRIASDDSGKSDVALTKEFKAEGQIVTKEEKPNDSLEAIKREEILKEERKRAQEAEKRGENYIPSYVEATVDIDVTKELEKENKKLKNKIEELYTEKMQMQENILTLRGEMQSLKDEIEYLRKRQEREGDIKEYNIEYAEGKNGHVYMSSNYRNSYYSNMLKTVTSVGSLVIDTPSISIADMQDQDKSEGENAKDYKQTHANSEGGKSSYNDTSQKGDMFAQLGVKPGDIIYATLLTNVNSDLNGPVIAEISGGKLDGWKAFGALKVNGEYMMLTFNRLVSPEGKSYNIKGIAVDPYTLNYNVEDDVDYHILSKIGAIFGAAFLQGYGEAAMKRIEYKVQAAQYAAQQDTEGAKVNDDVTNDMIVAGALGRVGTVLAQMLEPFVARPNTVLKYANSGMGILIIN